MKKVVVFVTIGFLFILFARCGKEEDPAQDFKIEGLTFDNYPKVDGSTSTQPLNMLIACKLLGVRCDWEFGGKWGGLLGLEFWLTPDPEDIPAEYPDFFSERVKVSQTHGAFMNLIDKNVDLIMTHRTLSPDEKAHAEEVGVTLIETPIALDAFVFVVNKDNPVKSLTVAQVQDIYTGEITNWRQVGGQNEMMAPFVRPRNSGSQEIMESLVMKEKNISASFEEREIVSMGGVFAEMRRSGAICYTFDYYKKIMVRVADEDVPRLSINGIFPDEKTISERTYPFVSEVHVAIRGDLDKNSTAYKLYELLQTKAGKSIIAESGYIPN
ncbi:MAG: substrate-binding domain-containing protein [Prevotellaceae bacterium]|jgi:phosphate transport system substrate-binding protein|nr:substrate-binding domain-containing protein [Prevotellaceae bacterium]